MVKSLSIPKGTKFNNFTIIKEIQRVSKYKRRFLCKCVCGNIKEINLIHLTTNKIKSCGCLSKEWHKNKQLGKNNPNWKGGKRIESGGYVEIYIPEHPNCRKNGYIKEHRVLIEKKLGRLLKPFENVHHIDGNKLNNDINNLELWNTSQPCGQRVEDKIKWAKEILNLYQNEK